MEIGLLASILSIAIAAGTSLVFATVGEIVTERAGILNLGVEGMMIMGAVTGFAAAFHTESVVVGVLTAMAIGGALALVHAFLTITLLADQVVSGLALTLLGSGLASFLGQRLGPEGMPLVGQIGPRFGRIAVPFLSELPLVGPSAFNRDILSYVMYLFVPVAWYFVYRTRPGLHLRAIGESPQAADAMGVNVFALRYLYTVVGGMLVGLGWCAPVALVYSWLDGKHHRRKGMDCDCTSDFRHLESRPGGTWRLIVWRGECRSVSVAGLWNKYSGCAPKHASLHPDNCGARRHYLGRGLSQARRCARLIGRSLCARGADLTVREANE